MLHAKFHGHWSTGSGEEVLKVFTMYMGMVAILVMEPGQFKHIFVLKATYEIWLQQAYWLLRKCLNL